MNDVDINLLKNNFFYFKKKVLSLRIKKLNYMEKIKIKWYEKIIAVVIMLAIFSIGYLVPIVNTSVAVITSIFLSIFGIIASKEYWKFCEEKQKIIINKPDMQIKWYQILLGSIVVFGMMFIGLLSMPKNSSIIDILIASLISSIGFMYCVLWLLWGQSKNDKFLNDKNNIEYKNTPPKEIQNIIWNKCFDYKDCDTRVGDLTVQNRINLTWYMIHKFIKDNPDWFIQYIKEHKPNINYWNKDEK